MPCLASVHSPRLALAQDSAQTVVTPDVVMLVCRQAKGAKKAVVKRATAKQAAPKVGLPMYILFRFGKCMVVAINSTNNRHCSFADLGLGGALTSNAADMTNLSLSGSSSSCVLPTCLHKHIPCSELESPTTPMLEMLHFCSETISEFLQLQLYAGWLSHSLAATLSSPAI